MSLSMASNQTDAKLRLEFDGKTPELWIGYQAKFEARLRQIKREEGVTIVAPLPSHTIFGVVMTRHDRVIMTVMPVTRS